MFLISSGRSSQEVACFSVERTKYLIVSKKIPLRSEPQLGIGFLSNNDNPLSLRSNIHCGSFFFDEISRTTSSFRPRRLFEPASVLSAQPYSYLPIPSNSGCAIWVISVLLLLL